MGRRGSPPPIWGPSECQECCLRSSRPPSSSQPPWSRRSYRRPVRHVSTCCRRFDRNRAREMSETVLPRIWATDTAARSALQASAIAWFVPALIGQWVFAYHIAMTYIGTALTGNFTAWNKRLFVGFIAGDLVGNGALVAHLFIAFVITVGGTMQLIPQVRTYAPVFHRWNGRLYIVIAFLTSLAALYMIWTRDTLGGILINDISVS